MAVFTSIAQAIMLLATAGVAIYTLRVTRRKTAAEASDSEMSAADKVTDAALKLIEPLNARIEELKAEVIELRNKIEQYTRDEVAYQAELHAKNIQIDGLRAELLAANEARDALVARVGHLEDVLRQAGSIGHETE